MSAHADLTHNDIPEGKYEARRPGLTDPSSLRGFLDNCWEGFNNLNVLLLPKRIHWFELEDLEICPPFLRQRAQATLTAQWTKRMPILQSAPPATLAAEVLQTLITKIEASSSPSSTSASTTTQISAPITSASTITHNPFTTSPSHSQAPLTIVDFCAGAGGPTPFIEHTVNKQRQRTGKPALNFLLTDLHPHIDAWIPLASQSSTLNFIPQSVDAARPPASVISRTSGGSERGLGPAGGGGSGRRIVRCFYLSFHHFDDEAARRILKSTLETSDAFFICELMDRRLFSLVLLVLEPLLIYLIAAPFWFFGDWTYSFFTYVIPLIPILMGWDGIVSLLRARTFDEIVALCDEGMGWKGKWTSTTGYGTWLSTDGGEKVRKVERDGWVLETGRRMHTWPLGWMQYTTGRRVNKED